MRRKQKKRSQLGRATMKTPCKVPSIYVWGLFSLTDISPQHRIPSTYILPLRTSLVLRDV